MSHANDISKAASIILQGGLVAFPTETVYGLGADATQDAAVAKIYAAKGRPQFNPLISHVADVEAAFALGDFSTDAMKLAARFWPGPLTLVVPRRVDCSVSLLASAGLPSLALRVPAHPMGLELLRAVGKPVVAPSANPSGRISPTSAEHVRHHLLVDMILDGGRCAVGVESSVVNFMNGEAELLRAGGLSRDEIEEALGHKLKQHVSSELHSPGMMESHYAPRAGVVLNVTENVTLGFGEVVGEMNLSPRGDVVEAAANLFRMLHELDTKDLKVISVAPIPSHGLGEAINDRLKRAAAPR